MDVKDLTGVEATVLISAVPEHTRLAMSLIVSILDEQ